MGELENAEWLFEFPRQILSAKVSHCLLSWGLLTPAPDQSPTSANVSRSSWSFPEHSLPYPLLHITCPCVLSEALGPNPSGGRSL